MSTTIHVNKATSNRGLWNLIWAGRRGHPVDRMAYEAAEREWAARLVAARGRFKRGRLSRLAEVRLYGLMERMDGYLEALDDMTRLLVTVQEVVATGTWNAAEAHACLTRAIQREADANASWAEAEEMLVELREMTEVAKLQMSAGRPALLS